MYSIVKGRYLENDMVQCDSSFILENLTVFLMEMTENEASPVMLIKKENKALPQCENYLKNLFVSRQSSGSHKTAHKHSITAREKP